MTETHLYTACVIINIIVALIVGFIKWYKGQTIGADFIVIACIISLFGHVATISVLFLSLVFLLIFLLQKFSIKGRKQ